MNYNIKFYNYVIESILCRDTGNRRFPCTNPPFTVNTLQPMSVAAFAAGTESISNEKMCRTVDSSNPIVGWVKIVVSLSRLTLCLQ